MDTLSKLFGSRTRVKLMRAFLLNAARIYEPKGLSMLCRGKLSEVKREMAILERAGLTRRKRYTKGERKLLGRTSGWTLDSSFAYLEPLRALLLSDLVIKRTELVRRIRKGGSIKLIAVAGVFLRDWDSRLDVLIVGDKLKRGLLDRTLRSMESDIGRELRYSILDTADFQYRIGASDRLVRDVFDFPHHILLNRLEMER